MQTAQSLDEGLRSVINLNENDPAFDSNNGKLVYLNGRLKTSHVWFFHLSINLNIEFCKQNVYLYGYSQ